MVESKYLVDDILEKNVGTKMVMHIDTLLGQDGMWEVVGACEYGLTMDGVHWGMLFIDTKSYDKEVGNGIATVMYTLMKSVSDQQFLQDLAIQVENAERESE